MKNRIALIIDKDTTILDFNVRKIMEKWGYPRSEYKTLNTWSVGAASSQVLFGKPKAVHLNLTDKSSLSDFVKFISDKKNKKYITGDWFGVGLIITVLSIKGATKIKKLVEESGGVILNEDLNSVKSRLLNSVNLPKNVKDFLSEYVGENYSILLNIVNSLGNKDCSNYTIDDVIILLPNQKGSIPPWEFINELFKGSPTKIYESLDRYYKSNKGSEFPLIALLKNKLTIIYHDLLLIKSGHNNISERAKLLGLNNTYQLKTLQQMKKKPTPETIGKILKRTLDLENKLKGEYNVSDEVRYNMIKNHIGLMIIELK